MKVMKKSNSPKISVIIPTFNRAYVLKRAIDSVLEQTYKDFELIIVDDGSTDETSKLLLGLGEKIRVIKTENFGVSHARNLAINASQSEYVSFLDSDDYWDKKKLQRQIETLTLNPSYRVIYTNEIWIRNGQRVNQCKVHQKYSGWIYKYCLPLCIISPSSVLIAREVLDSVGLFDEDFEVCEDYELWLRLSAKYQVFFLDENLIFKTGGHDDQLSKKMWGMDRYRVKGLIKALSLKLSEENIRATKEMIIEKARILSLGFKKHGKLEEYLFYENIISQYSN